MAERLSRAQQDARLLELQGLIAGKRKTLEERRQEVARTYVGLKSEKGRATELAAALSRRFSAVTACVVYKNGDPSVVVEPAPVAEGYHKDLAAQEHHLRALEEAEAKQNKELWPTAEAIDGYIRGFGDGVPSDYESLKRAASENGGDGVRGGRGYWRFWPYPFPPPW